VSQVVVIGELSGQVRDETGAALPGVTITVVSRERGFSRTTTTDSTGRYRFSELQPGRYNVTATLSGFGTVTTTDNLVESNRKTELSTTMKLSAQQAAVTVTGEVPIVDKSNTALETRQRAKEFEKMPVGRSYQSLFLNAPGVNLPPGANPNPNVHGALGSNNLWLYDGVDTTDPTTGTFGGNLNFEAIQEVTVITSGVSAEYGRAAGGVINVVTKSGTNQFAGSGKVVMTNDNWNAQNTTVNKNCSVVSGALSCPSTSLARTLYDHVNPRYAVTLGGPIWQDHVWFFGAYESANNTTGQRSTAISGENYQQTTEDRFWDGKLTAQITPSITLSARGSSSPTSGFVVNYGNAAEFVALTGQDQTAQTYAGFMTGVFGTNVTAEIQGNWNGPSNSASKHGIDVHPLGGGAPHFSNADGFYYNGAFFDGFVNRPRQGILGAATYYTEIGGNSHSFKGGVDYQHLNSTSLFGYPNNQLFIDQSFDFRTRTSVPASRRDYAPPVASTSLGNIIAVYARDKFEVGKHLFFELGLRYEHQKSEDDISRTNVDKGTVSPRFSASYDVFGTGKSLVVGTYGRFYQFVLQSFADAFGQNVQRGTYDNFNYNTVSKQYEFAGHVSLAGSGVILNPDIKPTYTDEGTVGFRQQIGNTMGVTVTGIYRKWGDIIDDIPVYNANGSQTTTYKNYGPAERKFYGVELVFDKRFSEHWNANASYAWGRTKLNTTSDTASSLGDYLNSNCRTTIDTTIGTGGVLPCTTVVEGPNKYGEANFSTTNNVKFGGAYVHSLGPANLALGLGGQLVDGVRYQKQRAMTVLIPGTTTNTSTTETYFYEPRGSEKLPTIYQIDASLEATFTLFRTLELGVKGEIFNVTNIQRATAVDQTTWCDDATATPTSSCGLARINFGKSTARASFQAPRAYRLTALMRF
jgi:outer membrane receptor protein involved in Fe transport